MIKLDIRDAELKFRELARELNGHEMRQATARAINHTIAKARTTASQEIRGRYNLKAADAKRSMVIRRANVNKQSGELDAATRTTPLSQFNPRETTSAGVVTTRGAKGAYRSRKVKRPKESGVTVEIIRGRRVRIPSAFLMFNNSNGAVVARGKYSTSRVFQFRRGKGSRIRSTGNDLPIGSLVTVSVYAASINDTVQARMTPKVMTDYDQRIQHEMRHILNTRVKG